MHFAVGGVGIAKPVGSRHLVGLVDGDVLRHGENFFDVVDEGMTLDIPILYKFFGRKFLGNRYFHSHFMNSVVVVHIVLSSVVDYIPVAASDVTFVADIAKYVRVIQTASIYISFAYVNPPIPVFVWAIPRGKAVPGIVHHFATAVKVGGEAKMMVGYIFYHCRVFRLECFCGFGERVGVVAVEVNVIGIVAAGVANVVVAAEISAVGIGKRIDKYFHVINKLRQFLVGAVAVEQGVDEVQHEMKSGQFVAVDGG